MDLSRAVWRKSTRSNVNTQCVEVSDNLPGVVAMRDSKDQDGAVLVFSSHQWQSFVVGAKAGRFSKR